MMPKFWDLKSKARRVTVTTTSITPSSNDSVKRSPEFPVRPGPKYPIRKATMRLFPDTQDALSNEYITTKHSNAFNSERASGMNKLQQLQYIAMLKDIIIDEAAHIHQNFNKYTTFKVITARKSGRCPVNMQTFSDNVIHVARLVAVTGSGSTDEWTILVESAETEFLADAVEDLWHKTMTKSGQVTESFQVGQRYPADHGDMKEQLRRKSCEAQFVR